MRKTFTKLAFMSLAMLAFASCDPKKEVEKPIDAEINLSSYDVKFTSPNDSTITIDVESTADWVATRVGDDGAAWLTLTPEEGKGGVDKTTMSLHVDQNTTSERREALIRVTSVKGNAMKEVTVVQFPKLGKLGQDSLILATFFEAGEGWNWGVTWILEEPISSWYGVTVAISDGDLRVTRLDFQQMGYIAGGIPESFRNLDQLVQLTFYQNSLGGTLPEWLPELKKLKEFCCASCGVGGPIPESYWDMTQIEHLRLENNGIKGPLSPKIGQLKNLKEIKLHECPIGGTIPGTIGDMTALRDIDLFSCGLEGEFPAGFGKGKNINNIRFDGNPKLTGAIPEDWGDMDSLYTINLQGCTKITSLPASLGKCKAFWELTIPECTGIKSFPEAWVDAGLQYIRAYQSGLTSIPTWKGHHPTLQVLMVEGCPITGPIPELTGFLNHAYYGSTQMTGPIPESLVNTKAIQNITLDSCNLAGCSMPAKFWLNDCLVEVSFKGSKMGGLLPTDAEYGDKVIAIQQIDISGCEFSGPLPSKFFEMTRLGTARLDHNNFTGTVPSTIGGRNELNVLTLSMNRLEGTFPATVAGLDGWSSKNMWNPAVMVCPQQEGFGFNGTCEALIIPEKPKTAR